MMSANLPLKESSSKEEPFHPVIRIAARIISFIFHPLFIPVYISWFLIYINPLFPAINPSDKWILLLRFIVMYTVFPLVTVFLAKGLGFIQSIFLKNTKRPHHSLYSLWYLLFLDVVRIKKSAGIPTIFCNA